MKNIYIGIFLLFFLILPFITLPFVDVHSGKVPSNHPIIYLIIIAVFCGLILWFWMFFDLIVKQKLKYKLLWGIAFITFNWVTAIIYFLSVYIPRNKTMRTLEKH
ncbi:MAG: hypothetical protein OEV42_21450 [Deltaproteobacteria bacterium]|nr:hypothetical protein [Deltaproteobacteria bacterium]